MSGEAGFTAHKLLGGAVEVSVHSEAAQSTCEVI